MTVEALKVQGKKALIIGHQNDLLALVKHSCAHYSPAVTKIQHGGYQAMHIISQIILLPLLLEGLLVLRKAQYNPPSVTQNSHKTSTTTSIQFKFQMHLPSS